MNKTEARLVAYLLRWALGQETTDPSHAFRGLADSVRKALGDDHPDHYEINQLYAERRPKVVVREQPPPPRPAWLVERDRERHEREQAEALAAFDRWRRYLGSSYVGSDMFNSRKVAIFGRVEEAMRAVRSWRTVSGSMGDSDELAGVAVRVAAETLANQVAAAAGDKLDPYTIAWVVAGLRCRRQPFCVGCEACQTVTSPHRSLTGARGGSVYTDAGGAA